MMRLGVRLSPVARMAPLPTIGMAMNTTPRNQVSMNSWMMGNCLLLAPRVWKIGSMLQ